MELYSIQISQEQFEEVHEIIVTCGKHMKEQYGFTHWFPPDPIEEMYKHAQEKEVYAVKQKEQKQMIGTFTLDIHSKHGQYDTLWHHPEHKALYVSKLAILPDYQGKGIGPWCMKEIERIATNTYCSAVRLDALLENTQLLKFYHCKLGYEIRECITEQDAYQDNMEWKLIVFEKVLSISGRNNNEHRVY